jgi:hypothetical protein
MTQGAENMAFAAVLRHDLLALLFAGWGPIV